MSKRECDDCRWFNHIMDPESADYSRPVPGECLRRSPSAGPTGRAQWPTVLTDESCGEWERIR